VSKLNKHDKAIQQCSYRSHTKRKILDPT